MKPHGGPKQVSDCDCDFHREWESASVLLLVLTHHPSPGAIVPMCMTCSVTVAVTVWLTESDDGERLRLFCDRLILQDEAQLQA